MVIINPNNSKSAGGGGDDPYLNSCGPVLGWGRGEERRLSEIYEVKKEDNIHKCEALNRTNRTYQL